MQGLEHPWDVQPIGGGRLLITERDTAHLIVAQGNSKRRVRFPSGKVWVSGETGLMSMEIDPGFARNRRFYTCQGGFKSGGGHDVRVIAWRLNAAATRATMVKTLLKGLPTSSGRHGGCRLLITRNGALLVGTGDAAVGTNPQNARLPGRQDAAAQPDHREAVAEEPVHQRQRQAPLRPDLRTPQRPGPRPAP